MEFFIFLLFINQKQNMKNLKIFITALTLLSIFFVSCEKENTSDPNAKGELLLSFQNKESINGLKSYNLEEVPARLLISIKNENGELILTNERVELFKFNDEYISTVIPLTVGKYFLTDFMVLDANNNVIYVAPKEGSEKAYLVEKPLSIEYTISEDKVEKVVPEVLSTKNITPEQFGYNTFSFGIVETFNFLIVVFDYNDSIQNFELTSADILIENEDNILYSNKLDAVTNLITLNTIYDNYKITISKAGYLGYSETFTRDSLMQHFSNPLTIILKEGNKLVLQPGEEGIDSWLLDYHPDVDAPNKNYGSSAEFMAMAWTNGGNNNIVRSLIDFDLSSIPSNVEILMAELTFYAINNTIHSQGQGHSQLTSSNACYLKRITESWDENTVTWNSQPNVSTDNIITLNASENNMQDYVIDITDYIADKYERPADNYGLMLELINETNYARMIFGSSDNVDETKRPKLEIYYTTKE